eukprot:Phypoly_transcript_17414.p1 GENE.Phypoly_transcript_17414~~Phypoly_transcript_17414.p1  ORF type:complete len:131 (-),score=18.85 Phypoly_transcript_17414:65-457(-)
MAKPVHCTIQTAVNTISLLSLIEKNAPKLVSLLYDFLLSSIIHHSSHTLYSKHIIKSISNKDLTKITNNTLISLFNLLEPHLPILHTISHLTTSLSHPSTIKHTISTEFNSFLETQHHLSKTLSFNKSNK